MDTISDYLYIRTSCCLSYCLIEWFVRIVFVYKLFEKQYDKLSDKQWLL